jgi:circadian clock protein KaiB
MASLELTLYVTGRASSSAQAIGNLHQICRDKLSGECDFAIVDVLEQPQLAEEKKIIATPTLVKSAPLPSRRIIGDLSDLDEVVLRLGLSDRLRDEKKGEER